MRATPNTIVTDNITRRRMLQGLVAMLADASVVLSATAANTAWSSLRRPPASSPAARVNPQELAALPRPRKHYLWYYSTREANKNLRNPSQGIHDFLRAERASIRPQCQRH